MLSGPYGDHLNFVVEKLLRDQCRTPTVLKAEAERCERPGRTPASAQTMPWANQHQENSFLLHRLTQPRPGERRKQIKQATVTTWLLLVLSR